jgi:hypothetical protein
MFNVTMKLVLNLELNCRQHQSNSVAYTTLILLIYVNYTTWIHEIILKDRLHCILRLIKKNHETSLTFIFNEFMKKMKKTDAGKSSNL